MTSRQQDYIRAFDVRTGKQLWQDCLPTGGQTNPMSHWDDGTQHVVTVDGGIGFSARRWETMSEPVNSDGISDEKKWRPFDRAPVMIARKIRRRISEEWCGDNRDWRH
ncbi:hypothetical protein [Swaminathania salitolerans]